MNTSLFRGVFEARFVSVSALILLLAAVSSGCGDKAADTNASTPYANTKNPAAVAPAPVSANPVGARGGPPEAEAYRQKMGPNAKAPGAR